MIEIKDTNDKVLKTVDATDLRGADLRWANLRWANLSEANLRGADLSGADLRWADLSGANLSEANLRWANLRGADLRWANLSGANLSEANLSEADLRGAIGFVPESFQPLMMLLDQPGKTRAYKIVNKEWKGYVHSFPGCDYHIGNIVKVKDANCDPTELCAAGINVATLDWCLKHWEATYGACGYKIIVVEFTAKDIACIPYTSDGKFRLHKCKVIGEKDISELV